MRSHLIAGALTLVGSATAFSDASPWILLSTSRFTSTPETATLQSNNNVLDFSKNFLANCPTDQYLIADQLHATATDLKRDDGSCVMPHLCAAIDDNLVQSKLMVTEVVGDLDSAQELRRFIEAACSTQDKQVVVDVTNLTPPVGNSRRLDLNDQTIAASLEKTVKTGSYTIIYYSSPGESSYDSDFDETVRTDLKRDASGRLGRRAADDNDEDEWRKLPLFEKYQYFTPGIFMGLLVTILLFTVLSVGIKALSSLQVSYGAFEKEMGPSGQKKQQ